MFGFLLTISSADIEQEVNGLYTFSREEKLDSAKVKALITDAIQTFYNRVGKV